MAFCVFNNSDKKTIGGAEKELAKYKTELLAVTRGPPKTGKLKQGGPV